MQIPEKTTVLVVGGGPAGSYCAATLAREGVDTVLLEAEKMPRYHIGESMLPSVRHFLRFIDLDEEFDSHGFKVKKGAAFKLNHKLPYAYTDFVAAGGQEGYAYNVVRSEADEMIFRHAGRSGAHNFDGVKVQSFEFAPSGLAPSTDPDCEIPDPGRPVSAAWKCKETGEEGVIKFDYLVDASGRAGMMSTKYLKNRKMNNSPQLKSVATWGYWTNGGIFEKGTPREGCPYFEALQDANGWVWFIPLHDGKWSVGVVMNQEVSTQRKREGGLDSKGLYLDTIKNTPGIQTLLDQATLVSDIKSASDWSYNAAAYASPYTRIAGDAACFIDPFFSSGVHLALTAGLSAATTICAALKGQVDEMAAATWHSKKISESYTRFLVVVSTALKQINEKDEPVMTDYDEKTFDRAFKHFRPIIQGSVDVTGKLSQAEVSQALQFCLGAFAPVDAAEKQSLLDKMKALAIADPEDMTEDKYTKALAELQGVLSPEQLRILHTIRARQMVRPDDMLNIDSIASDVIDGLSPNLVTGQLGLVDPEKAVKPKSENKDSMALLIGEEVSESSIPRAAAPVHDDGANGTNGHHETNGHATNKTNGVNGSNGVNGHHEINGVNGHDETNCVNGHGETNGVNGHGETNGVNGHGETNGNGVAKEANGEYAKEEKHIHVTPLSNGAAQIQDETTRLRMQDTLRRVADEMETPHDTMLRLFNSTLEISVVKAALDLNIFKRLSTSPTPLTTKQLAAPSGADPALLGRLLRYLASVRMIAETDVDTFGPNNVTHSFVDPRIEGALSYTFELSGPVYQALPGHLADTHYQTNADLSSHPHKYAFNKAFDTSLPIFAWLQQRPEKLNWFQQLMSVPREGDWLDVLPRPAATRLPAAQNNNPEGEEEDLVFVDVGGGYGQQCARLTAKFPELASRVVLQDRPEVVAASPAIPGVRAMGHDFFGEQPLKNAQFYYLRTVLHDWNDEDAAAILRNIVPAMGKDSKILIDEMVLPDKGVHWWGATLDLHMYVMLGALERSESQWKRVLDMAGLRLVEIKTYSPVMRHSIIVAEPK